MLTELGIYLRKLRLDNHEIMKDMAKKLEVSTSFLSAVENGKKKMPESWIDRLVDLYDLNYY
ncbi:MAG: helix-turn-helix transcriptional regulator [Tissierellia bacterium]|nr:helix-turn-helix transcriptional regulator [Tissierellia bacterium]